MNFRTLIRRSLRYHWRSHLGVVIGAAIGSAALLGALIVGDSVKGSLRERALERLGEVGYAMHTQDRFVTDKLANGMQQPMRSGTGAGGWDNGWDLTPEVFAGFGLQQPIQALTLSGTAARSDGTARANNVQLIGVPASSAIQTGRKSDDWFFYFFGLGQDCTINSGSVWVNKQLAGKLNLKIGEDILLRATKPSALAGDAALSAPNDRLVTIRLRVDRILEAPSLANFSLHGGSRPIPNAFMNRDELQKAAELGGRVNLLLQTPLYASGRGFKRGSRGQ